MAAGGPPPPRRDQAGRVGAAAHDRAGAGPRACRGLRHGRDRAAWQGRRRQRVRRRAGGIAAAPAVPPPSPRAVGRRSGRSATASAACRRQRPGGCAPPPASGRRRSTARATERRQAPGPSALEAGPRRPRRGGPKRAGASATAGGDAPPVPRWAERAPDPVAAAMARRPMGASIMTTASAPRRPAPPSSARRPPSRLRASRRRAADHPMAPPVAPHAGRRAPAPAEGRPAHAQGGRVRRRHPRARGGADRQTEPAVPRGAASGDGGRGPARSLHDELRMQGAGGVDAFQDVDHVVGGDAQRVQPRDHL